MLGDRQSNAGNIYFLKSILTDKGSGYLTGYGYYRRRIKIGISNTGYQIGGTGTRGSHTHPHLPRGSGIAIGGMSCPLLVTHQNMAKLRILGQGVI